MPRTTDEQTGWGIVTFDFLDTAVAARVDTFCRWPRNIRCHSGSDISQYWEGIIGIPGSNWVDNGGD